jgi:CubicO group peptidase (beta-lactamase class C family)
MLDPAEALAYAERNDVHALLVVRGGSLVCARYGAGQTGGKPHALYSGTKSFWGVVAAAACDDGLLALDEPVADTISEWRADDRKSRVTLRQLLNLTSGFGFGGLGAAVPPYAKALALELRNEPGATFTYGGIPLQVFGAVLARKLEATAQTPHDYLRTRVLDPLGITVASWRTLADGTQPLPTGAYLAAREWLKYGQFLARGGGDIVKPSSFSEVVRGSDPNPRYGLGIWLYDAPGGERVFYASGAGGQGLYIIPEHDTVVVRFGGSASYKHDAFLARLFGETAAKAPARAPRTRRRKAATPKAEPTAEPSQIEAPAAEEPQVDTPPPEEPQAEAEAL